MPVERHAVFRSDRLRVTERLVRGIRAERVLEIGAGDHSFIGSSAGHREWVRADFAPPADVICDLNSDAAPLPFADRTFDLAICTQVLEHLLWPQHLLAEIRRVLAPGGALVASVPNIASLTYRVAFALGHLPSCAASGNLPLELGGTAYRTGEGRLVGGHVVDFTRARFEALLRGAGLEIEEMKGSGIIWHGQLLPAWLVPPSLASNLIAVARRA